jgi:DNA modification methylase
MAINRRRPIGLPKTGEPLSIVYRSIEELKGNPKNPRLHSKKQIQKIARSVATFGFNMPLLVDGNLQLIAGHGRLEACKLLGIRRVPTICLEHLSEIQTRTFMIADNRLTENSTWDDRLLAEQFKVLAEVKLDFNLEVTGFEIGEINLMIDGLTPARAGEEDPADPLHEMESAVRVTQAGDLWLLGRNRLVCGDALDEQAYFLLMDGPGAAAVFIDPPSEVKVDAPIGDLGRVKRRRSALASREMGETEFTQFLTIACRLLATNSRDGSLHYVCLNWRHLEKFLSVSRKVYAELTALCVWNKGTAGTGNLYGSQHELILVFRNGETSHRNDVTPGQLGRNRTNVWDYPGLTKPVGLVADAIMDCTATGEIVLDTFLGNGTTLIAAERTGRICYGIEIASVCLDAAIRRWQKFTGHEAVKAASGRTFNELEEEASHESRQ